MKKFLIFLLLIAPIVGCSFSKNKTPKEFSDSLIQSGPIPDQVTQQKIFSLLELADLSSVERELQRIGVVSFEFTNSSGNSPSDVLFKLNNTQKSDLFQKYGLSIYTGKKSSGEIISSDLAKAKSHLNRYASNFKQSAPFQAKLNQNVQRHQDLMRKVLYNLSEDKLDEAISITQKAGVTCSILYQSLVLNSISIENRPHTRSILELLKTLGCESSIGSNDLSAIYQLEARKVYQDRFHDVSLLLHLISSSKLHNKMIRISDVFDFRISPVLFFKIGKSCTYDSHNVSVTGSNQAEFTSRSCGSQIEDANDLDSVLEECRNKNFEGTCLNKKGLIEAEKAYTINYNGFPISSENFSSDEIDLNNPLWTHIEAVIYGFNDTITSWEAGFGYLFHPDPLTIDYYNGGYQTKSRIVEFPTRSKEVQDLISETFQKVQKEPTPATRLDIVASFMNTFNKKYSFPYSPLIPEKKRGPPPAEDEILSNEDLENEIRNRLLFSETASVLGRYKVDEMGCEKTAMDFKLKTGVTFHQLSLQQADVPILIAWDLLKGICKGIWQPAN